MTSARSIVCGSCGSDVPYGRLSCPACGDLLASVAGRSRAASVGSADTAAVAVAPAAGPAAVSGGQRVEPSVLRDAAAPTAMATLAFDDEPLDEPATSIATDAGEQAAATDRASETDWAGGAAFDAAADEAPAQDASAPLGDHDADPDADLELEHMPAFGAAPAPEPAYVPPPIVDGNAADRAAANPPPPGAYIPPVAGMAGGAGAAAYAMPGGPAAPARAWAGYGAAGVGVATSDDASDASATSIAGIDAARLAEFVGWLAIAGGALAAVGFLLPWGPSVIGATGVGYLDRWGLAGPFHPFVAIGVVAVVVLVIVPNRIPAWIRLGLAGTILGVFMLGLVWPYVFGFSSTGPGALAVGVGAAALLAAGVTCLVSDRHARSMPAV
jgi:hypothetical protein